MIHAYDDIYLAAARITLGTMLDFAIREMWQDPDVFWRHFLNSGVADRFGKGDFQVIAGRSGVELAYDVMAITESSVPTIVYRPVTSRSPEYWAGWALAYYQWRSALSFKQINDRISISTIIALYHPYHEMDISQFCDRMNQLYSMDGTSQLQQRRRRAALSQSKLAELSQIPLRTLQKYESKERDLSQASFETVYRLSQVLRCEPLDLIERT